MLFNICRIIISEHFNLLGLYTPSPWISAFFSDSLSMWGGQWVFRKLHLLRSWIWTFIRLFCIFYFALVAESQETFRVMACWILPLKTQGIIMVLLHGQLLFLWSLEGTEKETDYVGAEMSFRITVQTATAVLWLRHVKPMQGAQYRNQRCLSGQKRRWNLTLSILGLLYLIKDCVFFKQNSFAASAFGQF